MRRARERERQGAEQDNRRENDRYGKTKLAKENTLGAFDLPVWRPEEQCRYVLCTVVQSV